MSVPVKINGKSITKSEAKFLADLYLGDETHMNTIINPFSGETAELSDLQLAVYDFIKGAESFANVKSLRIGLDFFRKYWPHEYMVLLD